MITLLSTDHIICGLNGSLSIAELVTIATALAQPPFLDLTAAGQFLEQLPQEAGPASLEVLRGECQPYLRNSSNNNAQLAKLNDRDSRWYRSTCAVLSSF